MAAHGGWLIDLARRLPARLRAFHVFLFLPAPVSPNSCSLVRRKKKQIRLFYGRFSFFKIKWIAALDANLVLVFARFD
jgi:hypothetical protein